jgi:hypothetical protein
MLADLADEERLLEHSEPWRVHDGRGGGEDALDLELRRLLRRERYLPSPQLMPLVDSEVCKAVPYQESV